jgi:hypothetical protein
MLIRDGFTAFKSGGSLGPFDILAFNKDCFRLVQCKYGTARLSRKEREEIKAVPVPPNCTKEYWLMKKHKKPLIELL